MKQVVGISLPNGEVAMCASDGSQAAKIPAARSASSGTVMRVLFIALALCWALAVAGAFAVPDAPFTGPNPASFFALSAAILTTAAVAIVALVQRQWMVAVAVAGVGTLAGIGVSALAEQRTIDDVDELLLAESQVHGELVSISQSFEADEDYHGHLLPQALKPLSRDDYVNVLDAGSALYIPVWENWRGEAGGGFVYAEDSTARLSIGPGYSITSTVDLGDGWWYAEGS